MLLEIKEKVKQAVNNSKEVTNKTSYNNSGIYMIYINNFEDDKVVPFYIGQAKNFQARYQQHITEIMSLNRFEYNIYKKMFLEFYYEGNLKSCKIFNYMVEHNCTLKDFHMVIIEETDIDNLNETEQKYFKEYYPEFLGFNQLNTVSLSRKKMPVKEYLQYIYEDSENIKKYYDYGYTEANFLIGFFKCHLSEHSMSLIRMQNIYNYDNPSKANSLKDVLCENKDLIEKINKNIDELAIKSNLAKFNKYELLIPKLESMKKELKNNIEKTEENIEKSCKKEIKDYFKKYNLNMSLKYDDVISSIIKDSTYCYDSFSKYLKNKKVKENIIDILNKKKAISKKKLDRDRTKLYKTNKLLNKIYLIETYWILRRMCPKVKYDLYPLQDNFKQNVFEISNNILDNICYINIEYTNHGKSKCFDVEPMKIDYFIKIKDKIIKEKDIFLHTQLDNFFEQDRHRYIEKEYENSFKPNINKEKFYIYLGTQTGKEIIINNYISTNMEYHTGINEFSLKNKEKTTLNEVLKKISNIINKDTKIIYTTSAYKTLILRKKEYLDGLENNLKDKILKNIKR